MSGADAAALPARVAYRLWADRYDEETVVTALEDRAVRALTPTLDASRLLDAGCGTGRRLPDRHAVRRAVGVDLVPAMLARGRQRRTGAPLAAADVRALPFRDASFDVVWCRLVVGHIAKLGSVYLELARVSRPGARVIVTDFHPAAAAAGHVRSFRDTRGRLRTVEHHVHAPDAHVTVARAAGLALCARLDVPVGRDALPYYERAGRLDRYEEQLGLPIVLALEFVRCGTG